jgi:hypothetical protein
MMSLSALESAIKLLRARIVPGGGTTGQVLKKKSAKSGDFEWGTAGGTGGYDGDPDTIIQDATHRFVSDTEKTTWNGKADAGHNHAGVYSPVSHNHDGAYSALGHNHDGAYSALGHNHDGAYSALGHNHDGAYSALGHNHDGSYAALSHNHDSTYQKKHLSNWSVADQQINAATSALLTGSLLTIPVGKIQIGSIFKFKLHLSKTAAGTAANTFIVRLGTAGTISDAALITFTLPVGTAVIDTGEIEITITIRGPLTSSCIAQGALKLSHNLSTTGLANVPNVCLKVTSGTFDPTVADLKMSVSCTTAASTVLTFQQVIAECINI